MANFIDSRFGVFPDALRVYEKRAELIAGNLGHEHTPNYKAQDIDFRAALAECKNEQLLANGSEQGNKNNVIYNSQSFANHLQYRTISQPSTDGNTVDGHLEQKEFAENSIRYLASLSFLGERVKNLMLAIKGNA